MASVQSAKRKVQSKSLVEKYNALKEIEEGNSCISIAKKYGVAKNTISHWLKKKQDIYRAIEENNAGRKRKRMKSATYEKLDKAIYKWFISVRHSNIPISASIIKLKALEFAKGLQCDNFQASDGWLGRWKERFNIRLKTVSGTIYKFFNSCSFKMFMKLPSPEKNSLHGTFIPFPSP